MQTIDWQDFERVELRVGRVKSAEIFAEARNPSYRLEVDFGNGIGVKKSSAQITDLYESDELVGRLPARSRSTDPECAFERPAMDAASGTRPPPGKLEATSDR